MRCAGWSVVASFRCNLVKHRRQRDRKKKTKRTKRRFLVRVRQHVKRCAPHMFGYGSNWLLDLVTLGREMGGFLNDARCA